MFLSFILMIIYLTPFLLSVAFITLVERKILSLMAGRLGPNKITFMGIGQPLMDALKLAKKQLNFLMNFSFLTYYVSSIIMLLCSLFLWCTMMPGYFMASKNSFIFCMMILSMNSLSVMMSGWSTFSKFSLIGSIRTVSLLISYESILYFCIMVFLYFLISFSIEDFFFTKKFIAVFMAPAFMVVWLISMLGDLNRTPFDFSEGESELVSGFNIEHGSVGFTFLFLSEYSNILFFSVISSIFFFAKSIFFFSIMMFLFVVWIRAVLPRHRFDKLMNLAWKVLIPLITVIYLFMVLEV